MRLPTYRKHKASGQAITRFAPFFGKKIKYLGKWNSPESKAAFREIYSRAMKYAAEKSAQPASPAPEPQKQIQDLVSDFLTWAKDYFGEQTAHFGHLCTALRPLMIYHSEVPCSEYTPKMLITARTWMIEHVDPPDYDQTKRRKTKPWSRTYINNQLHRIRRAFQWGVENGYVDASVLNNLREVSALRLGKTTAPETDRITVVDWKVAQLVLPYLPPMLRAMVQIQFYSGMRSAELTTLRVDEIDTTLGDVWLFEPHKHKTAWRGKRKIVAMGSRSIALLKPYYARSIADGSTYIFRPGIAMEEHHAIRAFWRRSKRYGKAKARKPRKRETNERYDSHGYYEAIEHGFRAMEKFAALDALHYGVTLQKVVRWHPHQLRHTRSTEAEEKHGRHGASALLGNTITATDIYSEQSVQAAIAIARQDG